MSLEPHTPKAPVRNMSPEATQKALIEALVMNVFGNDGVLSKYGPADRRCFEEDLAGRLKDAISDFVGENGDEY